MKIFIKNTMKTLPLMTLLAFSFAVEAGSSNQKKSDKTVDVKCFVELVGGGNTISFWNIPKSKVSNMAKFVTGQKIAVPNSKQKVKIYKAYECVLLKESFTSSKAKIVDAKTAR